MKKKEKLILSAILLAVGTVLNLFFTAALHGLMSGQYGTLTLVPFQRCLTGLLAERQQSLLFLSFQSPLGQLHNGVIRHVHESIVNRFIYLCRVLASERERFM